MFHDSSRVTRAALSIVDDSDSDWDAAIDAADADERRLLSRLRDISAIAGRCRESDLPMLRWGQLDLIEPLGRGGHGEVYLAWDARLARHVAVKFLHHPDSDVATERAMREARTLARVKHPNVLTIHGADEIAGRAAFWMELVRGHTLEHEIRTRGPLPPRRVAAIGAKLCRALQAVHAAGIVHRDIKASNVMREPDGRLVLMDFGIGDVAHDAAAAPGRALVGTPMCMAPELFAGRQHSVHSDIYALGVLLSYLATGRYPLHGRSLDEIREHHRLGLDVREESAGIPRRLRAVIARALAGEPQKRFGTASEMAEVLDEVGRPKASAARRIAVGSVAGLVALWAAWSAWQSGPSAPPTFGTSLQRLDEQWHPNVRIGAPFDDGAAFVCSDDVGRLAVCDRYRSTITPVVADDPGGVLGSFAAATSDGAHFAYLRTVEDRMELHVVRADGTGDKLVYRPRASTGSLRPGTWAANGKHLLGHLRDVSELGEERSSFVRIDPSSNAIETLAVLGHEPVEGFSFSPDGRLVAFDYPRNAPLRDIAILDLTTGEQEWMGLHQTDELLPMWTADGASLVFCSTRDGTRGLWMQTVSHVEPVGEPRRILDAGRSRPSPIGFGDSGRTLFLSEFVDGQEVFVSPLDLDAGRPEPVRISRDVLARTRELVWSPDGRYLAHVANAAGTGLPPEATRVVIRNLESRGERDIGVPGHFAQARLQWAPDSRWIRYGWFDHVSRQYTYERIEPDAGLIEDAPAEDRAWRVAENADGAGAVGALQRQVVHISPDGAESVLLDLPDPWKYVLPARRARIARRFAIVAVNPKTGINTVRLIDESSVTNRVVMSSADSLRVFDWTLDGKTLFIGQTSPDDGVTSVHAVDVSALLEDHPRLRSGPALLPTQFRGVQIGSFTLHPDGSKVAYSVNVAHRQIWSMANFSAQ